MLRSWLRSLSRPSSKRRAKKEPSRIRLRLEQMEERAVPTVVLDGFPPVGGVGFSASGSSGRSGGRTQSFNFSSNPYAANFTNVVSEFWTPGTINMSLSGAGEVVAFTAADRISLSGNQAMWQRSDIRMDTNGDNVPDTTVTGRFTLTISGTSSSLTANFPDGTVSALGAVLPVTGGFNANLYFSVSGTPADDYYDANSLGSNGSVKNFNGTFWHEQDPVINANNLAAGQAGNGSADSFRTSATGGDLFVHINNTQAYRFQMSALNSLKINGSSDDDTMVTDQSGGIPFPTGGFQFDGSTGRDGLSFINGGAPDIDITGPGTLDGFKGTVNLPVSYTFDNVEFANGVQGAFASAGGPYAIKEGDDLLLDGSGSSSSTGLPLTTYEWDLNNDNIFTDATGANPTVTWAQLEALGVNDGPGVYTVTLRVSDGFAPAGTDSTTLAIANTAPTQPLDADVTPNRVPENASIGQSVGITASSTDTSADTITYVLIDNAGGRFAIGAATGVVTVADPSSFDGPEVYTITVRAEDEDGAQSPPQNFAIFVTNAAPTTPIDNDASANTIAETAANGQTVGITAAATDIGADTINYLLTNSSGGRFQIDSTTGVVTVANAALLDGPAAYQITVRAYDEDGGKSTQDFVITVTNAAPTVPVDIDIGANTIPETAVNGQSVEITARSTDVASDSVTYVLTDDEGGRFKIDATTGIVTVANAALLEDPATYTITVRADDEDGGSSATQDFDITVTNSPPSQPVDLDASANTVAEDADDGATVGITIQATDGPNDTITYLLTNNAGGRFKIDATTGIVTVANAALLDGPATHTISVRADDEDGGQSVTQDFSISVTNVAPTMPDDSDGNDNTITEGAGNGAVVFITANSTDITSDTVSYVLVDNAGGRFGINAATGVVTVANAALLDGDTTYVITIRADDEDGGQSATANFDIDVSNVAPTASFGPTGSLNERRPITLAFTNSVDASAVDQAAGFTYYFDFNNDGDFTDPGDVDGTTNATAQFTFPYNGSFTVHGRIADKDGDATDYTTKVGVRNVDIVAFGAEKTFAPRVRVLDSVTNTQRFNFLAFDAAFKGGVRVATGDVNGDGIPDIITAMGPGGGAVRLFDGVSGAKLAEFSPFGAASKLGVFVAAGDTNNDGFVDIVVGTDSGATASVRAFDGKQLTQAKSVVQLVNLSPYAATHKGGVRVAVGDVDNDGFADIITAPGTGIAAQVRTFSGKTQAQISSWTAFTAKYTGGVFVSAGDVDGDGKAEVVVSQATGKNARVRMFNGQTAAMLRDFDPFLGFAVPPNGVRISLQDADGDGKLDLIAAPGAGASRTRIFKGNTLALLREFEPLVPSYLGGVYVG